MTVTDVKELSNMGFTHDEIMQLIAAENPAADPKPEQKAEPKQEPEAKPEAKPEQKPDRAPEPKPDPAPAPAPNNMEVLMKQLINETRSMKAAIQNNNTVAAMVGSPNKESASDILATIINPTYKEGE